LAGNGGAAMPEMVETYYQNIVDADGTILKRELLTRLGPNPGGPSLEEFFLKISPEKSMEITVNQIEIAARVYENSGTTCSVNVDNCTWLDDRLKELLIEAVNRYATPLVLEFTELRPMPPPDEINAVLLDLKRHGVKLALDDFGTGLNGISVFADYDFDIVKIDRKLTLGLQERPQKLQVLAHVLDLLNLLGKDHVVEGVEDDAHLKALVGVGFTTFQGFVFHRPAPVEELL
jgi:EAL domain-containing protein (putative c-di-GMP-specific phosphodiesterase class I)